MTPDLRQRLRKVLGKFGIEGAERAVGTGDDEEVILIAQEDLDKIDVPDVTLELMRVLPHVKIWIVQKANIWETERL